MTKTIVITGFMGCGKSQVARELARRLDVLMIDLDDRITASEGRTPAELITEAIVGGVTSPLLAPFSPDRFSSQPVLR